MAAEPKPKPKQPPPPPRLELRPSEFRRDLTIAVIGVLLGFGLTIWWDVRQRAADRRDDAQAAANVFYSQTQTNYQRMTRSNAILRSEMSLLAAVDEHVLDASPLPPLQETSDELLVRLAPSVKDAAIMDRILTIARETGVTNSQIRWRDMLRARGLQYNRDLTVLFRADSLLLENNLVLMGQVETPDTLWRLRLLPRPK